MTKDQFRLEYIKILKKQTAELNKWLKEFKKLPQMPGDDNVIYACGKSVDALRKRIKQIEA